MYNKQALCKCRSSNVSADTKELGITKHILGFLCLLGLTFWNADAIAGVAVNAFYDLATTTEADLAADGWQKTGTGTRTGTLFTTNAETLVYEKAFSLGSREAWQLEVVLSAPSLSADGERGPRFWVRFADAQDVPDFPAGAKHRFVEVRLARYLGINRIELWDANLPTLKATLDLDWTGASSPYRMRIKRQVIDGYDYIVLQAEPQSTFDDPTNPNPDPDDSMKSVKVPRSDFAWALGNFNQFGFGQREITTVTSTYSSVHASVADDDTTLLPYWPLEPPAPTLVHDNKGLGNPQGIDFSVDLSGFGYLTNDTVTPELDADGTTYVGETRTNPGIETWDFDGLNDNQVVYGRIIAAEVSGRSRTGSDGTTTIMSLAPRLACNGFEPPMDQGPVTVRGKNRVLPLKAQLIHTFTNLPVTDADILAPPVVEVSFEASTGGVPVNVEDEALSAGQGTEGVQFVYTDDEKWQFNLETLSYSAAGTYVIKMVSGDNTEYVIDPSCDVAFVVP